MALTLKPGTLVVASAYPDPPLDLIENGSASGFDIELMHAISAQLGVVLEPVSSNDRAAIPLPTKRFPVPSITG